MEQRQERRLTRVLFEGGLDAALGTVTPGDIGHRTRLEPQAGRRHRCQCGNRQSHGCAARRPRRQRGPALPGTAQSAYCAAKHAIQGFSESLRCELMHDGSRVRVTMVQLPAVNTPQFDWSVARLPRAPQPIPPIYQPAVAARAVVYAADHPRRREHEAGFSSVGTITANKLAPGLLDRYLARTAYRSQQTGRCLESDRRGNLWDAADGRDGADYGVHGPFSEHARRHSPQRWLARHRTATAATGAAAAVGAYVIGRQVFRR